MHRVFLFLFIYFYSLHTVYPHWNGKVKRKIEIFYAFSTPRIFHTPHFPHPAFSTPGFFHTPRFPHLAFSTPRIFHTPHFPHSALCTPRFPLNPPSKLIQILGDGNCLFRALSYAVTGRQIYYTRVRAQIINHMRHIENFLIPMTKANLFLRIFNFTAITLI